MNTTNLNKSGTPLVLVPTTHLLRKGHVTRCRKPENSTQKSNQEHGIQTFGQGHESCITLKLY